MALLDSTVYDLTTPEGQRRAIQDIIGEHNDQFDKSSNLNSYQVAAYCQLNVNLIDGNPSGVYTTPFRHGLGFAPVVIPFGLVPGAQFYNPLPYVETSLNTPLPVFDYSYFTVDENNLYFNVLAIDQGGFFVSDNWSAAFYIFNIPAKV